MKKFTLIAGMALVALGASAQSFNSDVLCVKDFAAKYGKGTYYNISMSDYSAEQLTKAGNTVVYIGPNSDDQSLGQNLWVWNGLGAGSTSIPAPGWDNEENMDFNYMSLTATGGWTGAGYNIRAKNDDTGATFPAINMQFSENSRLFFNYATTAVAPKSVGFTILDQDGLEGEEGHFSIGASHEGWPVFGAEASEDWQSIDVSFGDMKKAYGNFTFPTTPFYGNAFAWHPGDVIGTNLAFDNIFFFTPESDVAIEGVEADDADAPVVYYNLQGVKVANPANGAYIKVQGTKATKVVL